MKKNDLEKLEKKVLSKKWGQKKQIPDYEVYREEDQVAKKLGWQERGGKRIGVKKAKISKIFWFFLFSLAFTAFLYFYYFSSPVFDSKSVKMYINGPRSVTSGELVSYKVAYRNESNVVLKNVNIAFEWPAGSIFEGTEYFEPVKIEKKAGVLMPNQEKTWILQGRVYGEKNSTKKVKVNLTYTPAEFNRSYNISNDFEVSVEAVPIFLNSTLPSQVVAGKDTEIKIEYINQSDASFSNMEVRVEYPAGFEFISSDPNPAESNNVWQLGTVLGNESGVILLKGKFKGADGENQTLSFDIGQAEPNGKGFYSIANSIAETQISSSALLVFQTVNDSRDPSADLGDVLRYKISYKNTTDTQISNVIILAQIEDSLVDLKTLNIPWGSFDGRTNSIIWNQSGVPELSILDPKEEGFVTFSVKINSNFTPRSVSDKNLKIRSSVQIASGSIPETLEGLPTEDEDVIDVKLNTTLGFNVSGYYKDGPIQNTGPLPPKVGFETTYAISWQIVNTTNDVKNAVVTASVPPNVKWTGVIDPKDTDITFDQEKGSITWKPGIVFAGSGFVIPSQRVDFQLSFLPALVHFGQPFKLISESTLSGIDMFTGKEFKKTTTKVDSSLKGAIKSGEARVTR